MITLKIFIKGRRRGYTVNFKNETSLTKFYDKLNDVEVINLGGLTFKPNEFSHSVVIRVKADKQKSI